MTDQTTHDVMVAQTQKAQELLDYFQGARAGFEDAKDDMQTQVNASLANMPEALRATYHVNPITGSDDNDGSTNGPFATLEKAVGSIPKNGQGTVYLTEDATLSSNVYLPEGSGVSLIISTGKSLYLETFVHGTFNQNDMGGFYAAHGVAPIALRVQGGRIVWPSNPTNGLVNRHHRYMALLGSNSGSGPAHLHVECVLTEFVMPADGVGCVLGTDFRGGTLAAKSLTLTGDMAGHWVAGVAAGAVSADVPQIVTNLTSL